MIFGTREKNYEMGSFTSEKCAACKEGESYTFVKITKFFVVLFINLIPLGSRYECKCESCGNELAVDANAGKEIAQTRFRSKNSDLNALAFLKLLAAGLVIAAAVAIPLLLVKPAAPAPQTLKDLVSEDGRYTIQNRDGELLGVVQVTDGEKQLLVYNKSSRLVGEAGCGGMTMHLRYEETGDVTDDDITLEYYLDDVGVLEDRYGSYIRFYHYDLANESLGYSSGIEDLTTIEYTSGKAVYPITQYIDDTQTHDYIRVLQMNGSRQVLATFIPTAADTEDYQLYQIIVTEYKDGRKTEISSYDISANTSDIVYVGAMTTDSTMEEIMQFIEQSALVASYKEIYEYYEDTEVCSTRTIEIPDQTGTVQSVSQNYDVTEKNGCYIIQPIEE